MVRFATVLRRSWRLRRLSYGLTLFGCVGNRLKLTQEGSAPPLKAWASSASIYLPVCYKSIKLPKWQLYEVKHISDCPLGANERGGRLMRSR